MGKDFRDVASTVRHGETLTKGGEEARASKLDDLEKNDRGEAHLQEEKERCTRQSRDSDGVWSRLRNGQGAWLEVTEMKKLRFILDEWGRGRANRRDGACRMFWT